MSAPSLTEFLLARIAEDEAAARAARDAVRDWGCPPVVTGELGTHIARHDPARVLADRERDRRIIKEHPAEADEIDALWCSTCQGASSPYGKPWPCPTLRFLALPFAGHPDYREEWKP